MRVFELKEFNERVKKVKILMQKKGIDVLISQDPANMNYLTGYDACSFYMPQCVLVSLDEEMPTCFLRAQDANGAFITTYLEEKNVIPYSEKTNINVNTLELEDALVLASYLGISIDDAEYLIMNNPIDGFKTIEEFKDAFTNYLPDKSMNNFSTNTESFYLISDTIYENYTFKSKSLITIEKGRATITTRTYNN